MKKNDLDVIKRVLRSTMKYLDGEILDEVSGVLDFLERYTLVSQYSHACEMMKEEGFFPITSVHRDDLEDCGFDASKVSDKDMDWLAYRMCSDYCGQMFHLSMGLIATDMKFPRKEEEKEEE